MRRSPRAGYALLFVYVMAATIAIMLYMAVPRVAFEAQRDKEQLLIDRGEQYKRAVQLYVRKFNRFPADIQALENTQNIRFLRKQYTDPMTGKNEWRLVHVGPGGAFTDSLVYGTLQKKDAGSAPQTFITEAQQIGGDPTNPNQGVNQAMRRRASDGPAGNPGNVGDPNAPGSGVTSGPVMVLPDGRIVPATVTGVPAPTPQPAQGGSLPGQQPNQPVQPGQVPAGFQTTANGPNPNAANLINQILTTPRPGGLNGNNGGFTPAPDGFGSPQQGNVPNLGGGLNGQPNNTGVSAGQSLGGTTVGGGFAGVASKNEQDGIKIYNDQTSYNKWEFVYDMTKDTTRNGGATVPGAAAQQPIQNGQSGVPQQQAQPQQPAQLGVPPSPTPTGTPQP